MSTLAIDLIFRCRDEVSYYIDSAEEARHIGPDTAMWLRYFCRDTAQRIGQNHCRNTTPDDDFVIQPDHFQGLADTGMRLDREYTDWLRAVHTPKDEKLVCTVCALRRIPSIVTEAAHTIADRAVQEELEFYPTVEPLTERVKSYRAKKNTNGKIRIHNWFPLLQRDQHVGSSLTTITNTINHARLLNEPLPTEIAATIRSQRPSAQARLDRRAIRDERKVLRLGMEELTELVGYDALRGFLTGGKPLVIPGQRATFKLRAQRIGVGSYNGSIVEVHVGDERVCNLCIHSPDTPILDHIASMVRHIQLGLEDKILEAGNPLAVAATGPVGIDVLDRKLERHINPTRRERVVVRRAPRDDLERLVDALTHDDNDDERVVFIGPSARTRNYQAKIARRASSYIYKTYLPDFKTPATKFREIYEVRSIRPPRILDIDLNVCDTPEAIDALAD